MEVFQAAPARVRPRRMSQVGIPPFEYGLESSIPLLPTQNYVQLLGWAHAPGTTAATRTRLVINNEVFEPKETLPRDDVAEAYPADATARLSGFKYLCYLPFGFHQGALEATVDGTNWHRLRTLSIPVSSHPLIGAIEAPFATGTASEPCRVEGWCFHPEFTITEVVLQFGNVEVTCEFGKERSDVAQRFPDNPDAQFSGFITTENVPRGVGTAKVRALTRCGRIYYLTTDLKLEITAGPHPKPPPQSPSRDLAAATWLDAENGSAKPTNEVSHHIGDRNILFVLHGDFTANSALHVAAFANELIDRGYDCVVAVPQNKETVGALPQSKFMVMNFDEQAHLATFFRDQKGPRLIHAWTPRERVREFCEKILVDHDSALVIHEEDNEWEILENLLGQSIADLEALSTTQLDALVTGESTHPHRGAAFLAASAGATIIVDELAKHLPPKLPRRSDLAGR